MTQAEQSNEAIFGNITLVEVGEGASASMLAIRKDGGKDSIIARFDADEQGQILASLFAAYIAEMFPEGEISMASIAKLEAGILSAADIDDAALAEINRLNLFGTNVELKH